MKVIITTSNAEIGVPLIYEMGQAALLALPAGRAGQGMVWIPIQCQSGRHARIHTLTCMTTHQHYLTETASGSPVSSQPSWHQVNTQ